MSRIDETMDLREIFSVLRKHLLLIVILSITFGIAGYGFSKYLMKPVFEADATMIVNSSQVQTNTVTYDQIVAAQQLVSTYAVILKSDPIMKQVSDRLGLHMTPENLARCVSVTGVNETEVLDITVTFPNAHKAAAIANQITKISPAFIIRTVKAGSVEVISDAKVNVTPVGPNITQNALIALLAGLVLSIIIAFTHEMVNNKLMTGDDIEKNLGISVLGVIPAVKSQNVREKEKKTKRKKEVLTNA